MSDSFCLFSVCRGGLVFWGDLIGAEHIHSQLSKWTSLYQSSSWGDFFKPSASLERTVRQGITMVCTYPKRLRKQGHRSAVCFSNKTRSSCVTIMDYFRGSSSLFLDNCGLLQTGFFFVSETEVLSRAFKEIHKDNNNLIFENVLK